MPHEHMSVVELPVLPDCDVCKMSQKLEASNEEFNLARYDSPIDGGSWGYMCETHMQRHGNYEIGSKISGPAPGLQPTRRRGL